MYGTNPVSDGESIALCTCRNANLLEMFNRVLGNPGMTRLRAITPDIDSQLRNSLVAGRIPVAQLLQVLQNPVCAMHVVPVPIRVHLIKLS